MRSWSRYRIVEERVRGERRGVVSLFIQEVYRTPKSMSRGGLGTAGFTAARPPRARPPLKGKGGRGVELERGDVEGGKGNGAREGRGKRPAGGGGSGMASVAK